MVNLLTECISACIAKIIVIEYQFNNFSIFAFDNYSDYV